jgi:hypothetical protein
VVLAVGSAMMSSIQKILQNRALNRVHNFDSMHENKMYTNYNPDGSIHDRLPFPKDLGAYMYDYMSEKETRKLLKKKRRKSKESTTNTDQVSTSDEEPSSNYHSEKVEMVFSEKKSLLLARIVQSSVQFDE